MPRESTEQVFEGQALQDDPANLDDQTSRSPVVGWWGPVRGAPVAATSHRDVVRLPDKDTFQQTWQSMTWGQRREVLKSVNKGQAMRRRKDARLAVMVARQQQRYWRWAWLFAPLVALLLWPDWVAMAVNAVLLGVVMGAFAWFRHRRAIESEQANLERLGG